MFMLTIAEVYFSPIGLSLVTKLSPPRIVLTIMGVWMMSWAAGQYFCGWIGAYYEKIPKDHFFGLIALMCIATGFVMLALIKPLKMAIGHGRGAIWILGQVAYFAGFFSPKADQPPAENCSVTYLRRGFVNTAV